MTRGPDPTAPLWRAAPAFRLLSCLYALGFQTAIDSDLRHPATAWVLFAVLMAWSAACAVAYLRGFGRRPAWVIAEIIVVVLLMWSNKVVASPRAWAGYARSLADRQRAGLARRRRIAQNLRF